MKKVLFLVLALWHAPLVWGFTIATGPEKGTYFQIVQNTKTHSEKRAASAANVTMLIN